MTHVRISCEECGIKCAYKHLLCPCLNCMIKVVCEDACDDGYQYWYRLANIKNGYGLKYPWRNPSKIS